jgi:hypothetical protein
MGYKPTLDTDEVHIEKDLEALVKDINDGNTASFNNLDI